MSEDMFQDDLYTAPKERSKQEKERKAYLTVVNNIAFGDSLLSAERENLFVICMCIVTFIYFYFIFSIKINQIQFVFLHFY